MNKNNFAAVPPMGWNSYDYYDTAVTEKDIKANADYMAKYLRKYGYEYVIVDIQWYAYGAGTQREFYQYIPFGKVEMDSYGRLLPCQERFPSSADGKGFGPLAAYVHEKGLKFGIHMMRGIPRDAAHRHLVIKGTDVSADMVADPASICDWNPDMYGLRDCPASQAYYDSLLELYASWGVDFIKCDDICNTHAYKERPYMGKHEIEMLHKAIEKSGRDIVLSLSPGPALLEQAAHYSTFANMWRITDDFWDSWELLQKMFIYCERWQYQVAAGCWPDCDMLPVGRIGKGFGKERDTNFTREEQKTMLTLWCLFRSPLMIGAELTKLDDWTFELLTNQELLEMMKGDYRPRQIRRDTESAVWMTDSVNNGSTVVAVFNMKEEENTVITDTEEWNRFGRLCVEKETKSVKDMWTQKEISMEEGRISVSLPAHGAAVFRVL